MVRRTQIKLIGHGKIAPVYPRCYNCTQGEHIEDEIVKKLGKKVKRNGYRVRLV